MSRVFPPEEARLTRQVVVKFQPLGASAGVNAERFEREIQLAARLQHPHIVPLLTPGASEDESFALAPSDKRLGELYEAKGNRERLGRLAQEPGT
jgi:serine/threonine protein kinase